MVQLPEHIEKELKYRVTKKMEAAIEKYGDTVSPFVLELQFVREALAEMLMERENRLLEKEA